MELVFNNYQPGLWISEFEVTQDFNLHIERVDSGYLYIKQRSTPKGLFDNIKGASFDHADPVVDVDFVGTIYPKYIQIISKVEPTYAEVTSNGEVTQIAGTKKVKINLEGGVVKEYEYEEDMTWVDWINSEYSMGEWRSSTSKVVYQETNGRLFYSNNQQVRPSDEIQENEEYLTIVVPM